MSFGDRLRNDAKLLAGKVSDGMSDGAWLLCIAVICGSLAITFGLILLATAVRA